MSNWLSLPKDQQLNLFNQTGEVTGLPPYAIEKDAWVTLVLRMLFASKLHDQIVFKGGTSLSKGYNLIERFSEDIDLSINREYLGFDSELSKGEIRKLRRRSHDFSLKEIPQILTELFLKYGINPDLYEIIVPNTKVSDQDPEIVHINYTSVFDTETYLSSRVLIEIGARSLNDPYDENRIKSLIDTYHKNASFAEETFIIRTIVPEKLFLRN
jgi:hypothetical protein